MSDSGKKKKKTRKDVRQMAEPINYQEELTRQLAAKLAKDAEVVESVRVSMAEIADGDTVSFEEAFGTPGPS
jgi:hypothetical protein